MLLAPSSPVELPTEALLARLRARRAALDLSGARRIDPAPAEMIAWLHPRLSRSLRTAILPYLEVEAMRILLIALRHRLGGEPAPAGLLTRSWLAGELPVLLEHPGDSRLVVARLEQWLRADYPFAAGLTAGYLQAGPGGVEQQLAAGVLGHGLGKTRDPVVRMALRFLVDVRNLLALLRHWRWQLRTAPPLLPGGELATGVLHRAWAAGDHDRLNRLVSRLSGAASVDLEPRAAERQLLGGLTLKLRRAGRDPLGVGVVIDSLWRCRIAAGNQALRQVAGEEDGLLAGALL